MVYLPFIGLSYFFAIGPTFVLEKRLHRRGGKRGGTLGLGSAMGLVNLAAFYSLLLALGEGPAAAVFPIVALALLVSVFLSMMAYHEPLAPQKKLAIAIALIAIVVMHV